MRRNKKVVVIDKIEVQPIILEDVEVCGIASISTADNSEMAKEENVENTTKKLSNEIQEPVPEIIKGKFKKLHIEDTYWLENDIYQTIRDMTEGKKNAKALIINQALKDYLKNNNMEITPLRAKGKKK